MRDLGWDLVEVSVFGFLGFRCFGFLGEFSVGCFRLFWIRVFSRHSRFVGLGFYGLGFWFKVLG